MKKIENLNTSDEIFSWGNTSGQLGIVNYQSQPQKINNIKEFYYMSVNSTNSREQMIINFFRNN